MDYPLARRNLAFVAGLGDDLRDVVADRLGEASRVDGNDIGIVDGEDVRDRLSRLAWPPNTEEPSVKELVEAMTGSL